ncbi:MAG: V4R domain-containing protein [Chloroflexota bacterium]
MATLTKTPTTPMSLPMAYVDPGRPLATVYAHLNDWAHLNAALETLEGRGAHPRLVYAYEMPQSRQLLAMLVLQSEAGASELSHTLSSISGLTVVSVQPPDRGLAMAEQQAPNLVGTAAVIFGRPIIGSLTDGIIKALGEEGEKLLHQRGREAGTMAASALPPLLQQLGVSVNVDLLTKRLVDLQVMGWATVDGATVNEDLHGTITLVDTFESEGWKGKATSPKCLFISGFIAGVFSFAFQRQFDCTETQCQATGAAKCQFTLQPS